MASPPYQTTEYVRAYKACTLCRHRKSRCYRAAGASSCQRCIRESRQCVFTVERRHAKAAGGQTNGPAATTSGQINPRTPSQTDGATPSRLPSSLTTTTVDEIVPELSNAVDTAMRTAVTSGRDALGLLFRTVEDPTIGHEPSQPGDNYHHERIANNGNNAVNPIAHEPPQDTLTAIDIWKACRFVIQGWFSAHEAIALVDFFHNHILPFTCALDDRYREHKNHHRLITSEPLLCCTILCISSHYLTLPTVGGQTRSAYIHDRLWTHVQHLLMRILLGQEKQSSGKLRSPGSIRAFLLLTEWHPRALLFPPPVDGWDSDLLLHTVTPDSGHRSAGPREQQSHGRWLEDVIRPTKRSENMAWMMLSCAISLACELGLFDEAKDSQRVSPSIVVDGDRDIKTLLYVYSEQLALQQGTRSLLPHGLASTIPRQLDSINQEGDTMLQALVALSRLARTASEALFASPEHTTMLLNGTRHHDHLNYFLPALDACGRQYLTETRSGRAPWDVFHIDLLFTRVYCNSICLQAPLEHSGPMQPLNVDDTDRASSNELIHDAIRVLEIAISLQDRGVLGVVPHRTLQRIIGAAVFLIKTLSLGRADTQQAEICIQRLIAVCDALRRSAVDECHLSVGYTVLIEMCVQRLKKKLEFDVSDTRTNFGAMSSANEVSMDLRSDHAWSNAVPYSANESMFDYDCLTQDFFDARGFSWLNDGTLDLITDLDATPIL